MQIVQKQMNNINGKYVLDIISYAIERSVWTYYDLEIVQIKYKIL